jgi:hypothetical protein
MDRLLPSIQRWDDCAYVDIDQLGICSPEQADDPRRHRLKARNLESLISNFTDAGARCIVVSGVVDARRGVALDSVPRRLLTVVRLRADDNHLSDRLGSTLGSLAAFDEARAESQVLETTSFADTTLATTGCSVAEVANDVLAALELRLGSPSLLGDDRPPAARGTDGLGSAQPSPDGRDPRAVLSQSAPLVVPVGGGGIASTSTRRDRR